MERIQVSIPRQMDDQNVIGMYMYICIWYVYDGILLGYKKE